MRNHGDSWQSLFREANELAFCELIYLRTFFSGEKLTHCIT